MKKTYLIFCNENTFSKEYVSFVKYNNADDLFFFRLISFHSCGKHFLEKMFFLRKTKHGENIILQERKQFIFFINC